jgi:hypothetical protein
MRNSDSALAAAPSFDNECAQQRVSKPSSKDGHRFICEAVFEQGYLACQVAQFLACHPSSVSRAFQ